MSNTLNTLTPNEFENLVFDLMQKLGLKNCVWRTPGRDVGRDLQGEWFIEDISGYEASQNWYIECKRYNNSVDWPTIWKKISYAESNNADVLLIAVSSSLSPQAVDEVNKWNNQNKVLKIRFWNSVDIESRLRLFPEISIKYGLSKNPQKDIALALLPTINLLIKYSDSAHSSDVFLSSSESKLCVLYSLSELVAVRLEDVKNGETPTVHPFRKDIDNYDWLTNSHYIEELKLDRYAFRTFVCYIRDYLKAENVALSKTEEGLQINFEGTIPSYVQNDLKTIALLSNMEIYFKTTELLIRGR